MNGALLQVNWAPVWKSGSVLEWLSEPEKMSKAQVQNIPQDLITDYDVASSDPAYL